MTPATPVPSPPADVTDQGPPSVARDGGDDRPEGPGARIPITNAKLGMVIFLCSLVMLFAGFVTAYTVLRFTEPSWPPPGAPSMPKLLWLTTAVIVLSSGTMSWAVHAARAGKSAQLRGAVVLTALLGLAFVAGQLQAWRELHGAGVFIQGKYGTVFYSLTGIHGLHVIGGVVALATVLVGALQGNYDDGRHEPVELAAMYWHFVDVIWLFLFAIL